MPGGSHCTADDQGRALQALLASLPGDGRGGYVLPTDALMLQLPDSADAGQVQQSVLLVLQQLLPQLGISTATGVQVRRAALCHLGAPRRRLAGLSRSCCRAMNQQGLYTGCRH